MEVHNRFNPKFITTKCRLTNVTVLSSNIEDSSIVDYIWAWTLVHYFFFFFFLRNNTSMNIIKVLVNQQEQVTKYFEEQAPSKQTMEKIKKLS